MARTVEECLALASASRAAAAAETLENVRRLHLKAAASWESLAQSARYVEFPCAERGPQPSPTRGTGTAPRVQRNPQPCKTPAVAPLLNGTAVSIGDALIADHLPDQRPQTIAGQAQPPEGGAITLYDDDGNLRTLEEIEADVIRLAIDVYRGRMAEVARRLGIGRSTLYRKLNDFGIDSINRPDGTIGM